MSCSELNCPQCYPLSLSASNSFSDMARAAKLPEVCLGRQLVAIMQTTTAGYYNNRVKGLYKKI